VHPLVVTPSVHVASFAVAAATGAVPQVAEGRPSAGWTVGVVDNRGLPVPGVSVTTAVYAPSWDAVDAVLSARTDASGTARFSYTPDRREPAGWHFVALSQVIPESSSTYYDSSQNTAWTTSVLLR
jgi:hypothetical protein